MSGKRAVHRTTVDHTFLIAWLIVAPVLSLALRAEFGLSIVIFFLVPAAYVTARHPRFAGRVAMFSALVSIPLVTVLDYMMEVTGGMQITQSIFGSFRIAGHVTVESYVWGFGFLYLIALYYEAYLDHHVRSRMPPAPRVKYLVLGAFALVSAFFFAYTVQPQVLHVERYLYLIWGFLLVVLPVVVVLAHTPSLAKKFFRATAYFFFLLLGYELTAIHLGQWAFPGEQQYVGIVSLLGSRFPLEELVYFVACGALATLTYFEFFSDDLR